VRGHFFGLLWREREARFAVAAAALFVALAAPLFFPAPQPLIQAQVRVTGLGGEQDFSVRAHEGGDASLDRISSGEALLTIVAPRKTAIEVLYGEETIAFTIHELILFGLKEWPTAHGTVHIEILGGKVVDWDPGILTEAYVTVFDNRFVLFLLGAFSLAYLYVRSRVEYRRLAPFVILSSLLVYQVLYFLDLTPTLYWDTPLLDPFVRACLLGEMAISIVLVLIWFPLRRLVSRSRPDWGDRAGRFIERYGILILLALPLLQHLLGNVVLGYNLQPTDARYTYMDWGRTMLDRGFLTFLSNGLLRHLETPLLSVVWAVFYGLTSNGYLASALVPLLYFEIAIISTFLLANEFLGRGVAFFGGLFLALSPLFSFASYFLMGDVAAAAMAVLTLWLFVLALKRRSLWLAAASGASLFLTSVTKLTGLYCAFLVVVVYLFSPSRRKTVLFVTLAFLLLLPLAFVAPYFLEHGLSTDALRAGQEYFATWARRPMFQDRGDEPPDWNEMILKSGQTHFYMGPVPRLFYFRYLVNAVGFPIALWGVVVALGAIEARVRGSQGPPRRLWALALWILPLLLFLSLWSMKNTRFSYAAFPTYAMLGAYGFALFKRGDISADARHGGLLIGISVVMLIGQSAAHYYNVSYLKNADYRDPIFIESSEPYYYIHRYYSGWHVGWNGAGQDHHFTGSIATDGRFEDVRPFELEQYPDILEVMDSNTLISFDTMTRAGEDGCDFVVDGGSRITFDLYIDGARVPERVYIYRGSIGIEREVASALPLTLPAD
jgi:4-amino-4-deoxy-L-arabinose transferase-like glycosyltransferase